MMSTIHEATKLRQSFWLHYLRRSFIDSGELRRLLDAGIRGVVIDPKVVEQAITCSADYDRMLPRVLASGVPIQEAYEALLIDDAQRAADILQPVYSDSEGGEGFVTLPLNPELAHNAINIIAEGQRLAGVCAAVNRPNIMIEVPATPAGIDAITALIADGCNVCVTQIYSLATYEAVAAAYLAGLEAFFATHSVWRLAPASVASVPLSAIDRHVDEMLAMVGQPTLKGKAGVSLAKVMYAHFRQVSDSKRWAALAKRGAHPQRLMWRNTVPLDFASTDTRYVDALLGADTVHALAPATLNAFRDHGSVSLSLADGVNAARDHLEALLSIGIDLDRNAQEPQERHVLDDARTFQLLVASVIKKRKVLDDAWQRLEIASGPYEVAWEEGLERMCDKRVMCGIWAHDASLWNGADATVGGRFGWMHVLPVMMANQTRLQRMVQTAQTNGLTRAVVLGDWDSTLVAEVFASTFGQLPDLPGIVPYTAGPHLPLTVVDATDESSVAKASASLDLEQTLFVVAARTASPSLLTAFEDLYRRIANQGDDPCAHFVAVTTRSSPLAAAISDHPVGDLFLDVPSVSGPYAALSYMGLVPAALTGLDLSLLLDRAARMACNASGCNCPLHGDNVAARLGTGIGALARAGCRRIDFVASDFIATFARWARHALALTLDGAVTARAGVPGALADDGLCLYLRLDGDTTYDAEIARLRAADRPVFTLRLRELYELGGLFFVWQMAATVAAYHLGVNPFHDAVFADKAKEDRIPMMS